MLVDALAIRDAVAIVSWLRAAALGWPGGETVVQSIAAREAMLALALGGCKQTVAFDGRRLTLDGKRVDLLLTRGAIASSVVEEVQRRVARERADGRVDVRETVSIVCHGHQGPLPAELPARIIPNESAADIIDGPDVPLLRFMSAHRILDGELPAEWAA